MVAYPRFTPTERRKLTMSARARESFKAVGIRGGAGPGEGAPAPSIPYYTLSEADRSTFEHTMNMMHDNDIKKSSTAKEALDKALKNRPIIKNSIDALYKMPLAGTPFPLGFFAEGAWQTICFMGYCTETKWEIPDEPGFCSNDYAAVGITDVDIQGGTYSVQGGQTLKYERGAAGETINDGGSVVEYFINYPAGNKCRPVICKNGQVIKELPDCHPAGSTGATCSPFGGAGTYVSSSGASFFHSSCRDAANIFAFLYDYLGDQVSKSEAGSACHPDWDLSGTDPNYAAGDEITVGFRDPDGTVRCDVLGNGQYDYTPTLTDMQPVKLTDTDFPVIDIPLDDLCDIIDDLQNDPNLQPYLPPPGTPPGGIPPGDNPVDPGTGLPPGELPTQPPDPGTNPFPGQPPTDVPPGTGDPGLPPGDPGLPPPGTVPPGPVVPAIDPVDSGIEDPAAGGCMTLSKEPAGFRDPKQAGGIARQYQPGQPMVIDYGEGSTCKTKITKVKPNAGEDGGPEICVSGQIDNSGAITEKTCYGPGPVTDAIQSVLGEMVAEGGNIIFDSDCARELHRPLCFRAGTLKRVILNKLLDMCGFCVFPMFDCNVIVGYCGPVGVIWTYHEDVDLIKFDLEYDGQEVFDYVQVCRGDFMTQSGSVAIRGNCVLYPVGSPASSVNGDRVFEYEVPYGTPDSELNSIAITLAAKLRAQALPEIAFGVPLNSLLRTRHQLRIQMPSVGFDAYYMVTRLARDYDRENGHLSTGLARWLRAA